MATRLVNVVIDSADPRRLADWWSAALGWPAEHRPEESWIQAPRRVDMGQGDVPWAVMGDPGGNEFCVADPWPDYGETGPIAAITVDCMDPAPMTPSGNRHPASPFRPPTRQP